MAKVTPIRVPMVEGRERRWHLIVLGDLALLRQYLVLELGEDIDDSPPEERMPLAEFRQRHTEFGLDRDGQPL